MNIHKLYGLIMPYFRGKRMALFQSVFHPNPSTKILDVGGGLGNWYLIGCQSQITILNIDIAPQLADAPPNFTFVEGDGTALKYADGEFDLGYSNSVIEHVGTYENQIKFAREICRVAKKIWVQTPARWFFVEPHIITPFIHYFPKSWQRHLIRNFSIWGLITKPSREKVNGFLEEVRLVNFSEFKSLFPDCEIKKEKFLFMTKSFIAIKR